MKDLNIKDEQLLSKIKDFLDKNKKHYSQYEIEFILNNYLWGKREKFVSDILRQIYDELGFLNDDENIYLGFIKLLEKNFDINQNIVEIGGGRLPRLGIHLAGKQKQGSVTVYDHKLISVTNALPNLKLRKEKFTESTSLKDQQILIGFMPCEATELIIKEACRNKLDFMIALCEGEGHNSNDFDDYLYDWQSGIIYDAKKYVRQNNLGTLEITNLEDYNDPHPVIYNRRNKN